MNLRFQLPAAVRYASSIGLALGVIALSFVVLLESPNGGGEAQATTQPILRAAPLAKPLPKFTAADFDISRSVPVVIAGKIAPVATAALPAAPKPETSATPAIVTVDAVNVRSGPSKTAPKTFVVRQGEAVDIVETSQGCPASSPRAAKAAGCGPNSSAASLYPSKKISEPSRMRTVHRAAS